MSRQYHIFKSKQKSKSVKPVNAASAVHLFSQVLHDIALGKSISVGFEHTAPIAGCKCPKCYWAPDHDPSPYYISIDFAQFQAQLIHDQLYGKPSNESPVGILSTAGLIEEKKLKQLFQDNAFNPNSCTECIFVGGPKDGLITLVGRQCGMTKDYDRLDDHTFVYGKPDPRLIEFRQLEFKQRQLFSISP